MKDMDLPVNRRFSHKVIILLPLLTVFCVLCLFFALTKNEEMRTQQAQRVQEEHEAKLPQSEYVKDRYYAYTLDNGIEALFIKSNSEDVNLALSIGAGGYLDPEDSQGLAHFVEHLLAMGGSKNYPEPYGLFTKVQKIGGSFHATTFPSRTDYQLNIPQKNFKSIVGEFSSIFHSPLFNEKFVEQELNALDAEWQAKRRLDHWQIITASNWIGAPGHSARKHFIGNKKTLLKNNSFSSLAQNARNFFEDHYVHSPKKLVIKGRYTFNEFKAIADKYFGELKPSTENEVIYLPLFPDESYYGKYIQVKTNTNDCMIRVDFLTSFSFLPSETWLKNTIHELIIRKVTDKLKKEKLAESLHSEIRLSQDTKETIVSFYFLLTKGGCMKPINTLKIFFGHIADVKKSKDYLSKKESDIGEALTSFPYLHLPNLNKIESAYQIFDALWLRGAKNITYKSPIFDSKNNFLNLIEDMTSSRSHVFYLSKNAEAMIPLNEMNGFYSVSSLPEEVHHASINGSGETITVDSIADNSSSELKSNTESSVKLFDKPKILIDEKGVRFTYVGVKGFTELTVRIRTDFIPKSKSEHAYLAILANLFDMRFSEVDSELGGVNQIERIFWREFRFRVYSDNSSNQKDSAFLKLKELYDYLTSEDISIEDYLAAFDRVDKNKIDQTALPIRNQLNVKYLRKILMLDAFVVVDEAFDAYELSNVLSFEEFNGFHKKFIENLHVDIYALTGISEEDIALEFSSIRELHDPLLDLDDLDDNVVISQIKPPSRTVVNADNGVAFLASYYSSYFSDKLDVSVQMLRYILNIAFFEEVRGKQQKAYDLGVNYELFYQKPAIHFFIESYNSTEDELSRSVNNLILNQREVIKKMTKGEFEVHKDWLQKNLQNEDYVSDWINYRLSFLSNEKKKDALYNLSIQDLLNAYDEMFKEVLAD